MRVKTRFFAAADVFFHAEAAEGDAFDGAAGEELLHQLEAGAVGEADVADEQVEAALLLIGGGECGAATVGGADLVAEALKEALHGAVGVDVIVDEQDADVAAALAV